MESVSFVGIDIKVIAWDERDLSAVAEDWLEVPPPVDAHNVEQYVMSRFGEPVDIALGPTDGFGEIVLGWVFPPAALGELGLAFDGLDTVGLDMMVVPFVRFPDGTRRELFQYTAELHHEFAAIVGGLTTRPLVVGEPPPAEHLDRLERERPVLVASDPAMVELQLAGWLRRMVAEGWTYLIIEIPRHGRYVQFLTHGGSWLRAEAVGDRHLGDRPLSSAERAAIDELGWTAPASRVDGCGNHWKEWGRQGSRSDHPARGSSESRSGGHRPEPAAGSGPVAEPDLRQAAAMGAATLCEIFGPLRIDEVEVSVGAAPLGG